MIQKILEAPFRFGGWLFKSTYGRVVAVLLLALFVGMVNYPVEDTEADVIEVRDTLTREYSRPRDPGETIEDIARRDVTEEGNLIQREAVERRQVVDRVETYNLWARLTMPFNRVSEQEIRTVSPPTWDETRQHVIKHRQVRRIVHGLRLGLDLEGGVEMTYRIEMPEHVEHDPVEAEDMVEVIRQRIDRAGLTRPRVQHVGERHILIQIPGYGDAEISRTREIIQRTGRLEFRIVADRAQRGELYEEAEQSDQRGEPPPEGWRWYTLTREDPETGEVSSERVLVSDEIGLTGERIESVAVTRDMQTGEFQVNLRFTDPDLFYHLTADNVGRQLGIILDDVRDEEGNLVQTGELHSAPVIQQAIHGQARITGRFTQAESENLKYILQSGSLRWPLVMESERRIGPYQGMASVAAGRQAIIIGFLVVVAFILLYYRKAGIVANTALLLNLLLLLAAMKTQGITLTLPGIAGILLTVGMSIDASVLIFERIREEIKKKTDKPLLKCVRDGHSKAMVTIIDADLTTLITALILNLFGTGPVRGFAITLSIGIVVSMFTALVVIRILFDALILSGVLKSLPMAEFVKDPKIPFISVRKVALTVSAVLVVAGMVFFFGGPGRRLGIEFMSGTRVEVNFREPTTADQVRSMVAAAGYRDIEVQEVWWRGEEPGRSFAIRLGFIPEVRIAQEDEIAGGGRRVVIETNNPMPPDVARQRLADEGAPEVEIEEQPAERDEVAYVLTTADPAVADRLTDAARLVYGEGRVMEDLASAFTVDGRMLLVPPLVEDMDTPEEVAEEGKVYVRVNLARPVTPEFLTETLQDAEAELTVLRPEPDALVDGRADSFTVMVEAGQTGEITRVLQRARFDDDTPVAREAFAGLEKIFPAVAQRLGLQAGVALFLAVLGIVAYVWFRFEFRFGMAAVTALVHDVCLVLAALAITGRELSLTVIAAILTVIGYSLNDTIVVFDRIRENRGTVRKTPFPDIVNLSINQTLSRTLLTSVTTLLAVTSLFVFGGPAISDFAFTLLVGVFVGTYSSIFIASPVLLMMGEQGAVRGPLSTRSARIARPLQEVRGT